MKEKLSIEIPEGVTAHVSEHEIKLSKGGKETRRVINSYSINSHLEGRTIEFSFTKTNKKIRAVTMSLLAHIKNMIQGLNEDFVYEMEICNVHFPMTVKVEGNMMIINNFLGEKVKRSAVILPHVHIDIKAPKITLKGHDLEAVSQTAANIEKATNVPNRDRRVFQDGIFITSKNGRPI